MVITAALGLEAGSAVALLDNGPTRCVAAPDGNHAEALTLTISDPQDVDQWHNQHPDAAAVTGLERVFSSTSGGRIALTILLAQLTLTLTGPKDLAHGAEAIHQMLGK